MSLNKIKMNELRNAANELNKIGALEEEIVVLGVKKAKLCLSFSDAVDLVVDESVLTVPIIEMYNKIIDATESKQQKEDTNKYPPKITKTTKTAEIPLTPKEQEEEEYIQEQIKKEITEAVVPRTNKRIITSLFQKNKGVNKTIKKGEGLSCFGHTLTSQAGKIDEGVKKGIPRKEICKIAGCSEARFSGHVYYLLKKGVEFDSEKYIFIKTPLKPRTKQPKTEIVTDTKENTPLSTTK